MHETKKDNFLIFLGIRLAASTFHVFIIDIMIYSTVSKVSIKPFSNMEGAGAGEPPDDRSCSFCGRTFYDKSGARNHMNKRVCPQSRGESPVGGETCETCGQSFSNKNNLRKHMRYEVDLKI